VGFDPADSIARRQFEHAYGLTNHEVRLLGPWSGRLSNRGERIALEKPQAPDAIGESISWIVIDEVIYFDRAPWPIDADGTGRPLQRLTDQGDGNNPTNWAAGFAPSPGLSPPTFLIDHPAYGATLLEPSGVAASVRIDSNQVVGSIHQVELFLNGMSLCVQTNPPWACSLAAISNEGVHALTAMVQDDSGISTSRPVEVVHASVSNAPASAVGPTSAALNGGLGLNGTANITIYWGPNDGLSDPNAWSNALSLGRVSGAFSGIAGGLRASSMYFYRCFASNDYGTTWAPASTSFVTRPPSVALSLAGSPLAEGGGVATLTASLSALSGSNVTVHVSLTGTAVSNQDYIASATSIVINAGNGSGSITLTGWDDSENEPVETIVIEAESAINAVIGSPSSRTALMLSDDLQVVNEAAGDVLEYSLTFNGDLLFGDMATIRIFWGPADGGTNPANWANVIDLGLLPEGPFSSSVTGLLAGQTYYYRARAGNPGSIDWADDTTNVLTTPAAVRISDAARVEGDLDTDVLDFTVTLSAT
ncbi:MAG: hypothetical protein AAF492_19545, partial [Verrucomicrobiota bacterium]